MRRFTSLVAAVLLLGTCVRPPVPADDVTDLAVSVRAVQITGGTLDGLKLLGAVELSAEHRAFGGLSGLLVGGGTITAVSDRGWLVTAPVVDDADGFRPGPVHMTVLRGTDGSPLEKSGVDAEGLARLPGGLAISFERDHRIEIATAEGRREIRDRAFEELSGNDGLEALATLPDGRLLTIAEGKDGAAFPAFVIDGTSVRAGRLAAASRHSVTGADVGPDGRLYVVLRRFSPIGGLSIRIHRYALTDEGLPDPDTREVLAAYEGSDGVDNMEGIALWTDGAGRTRLALISDDNFSPLQRTLLMDFEVVD